MLLSGPAGTGKSLACLWKLHFCASKVPGLRALIVRKTRESLTESALVTFEQHVLPPTHPVLASGGQRRLRQAYQYSNGSAIVVGGMDKPGKIMSTEFDMAYVQEAIELDEASWEALTTRLRNGVLPYQQLLADTNPDRPTHWLKKRCDAGRTLLLESRHEDNPRLWDGANWTAEGQNYLAKLDALTGPRKQRLRFGRWVQAEGVVYDAWDAVLHVVEPFAIPRDWSRYWAVDFGYTNPLVCQWWATDPDGRAYLYREWYRTQTLVEDAAREWLALSAHEPKPKAIICDHDAEGRATLERHLRQGTDAALKDIPTGIQAMAARLRKAGDGKPRLHVLRDSLESRDPRLDEQKKPCGLVEEIDGYVWDVREGKKPGEEPVDKDNHALDAARYLCKYLDDPQPELNIIPILAPTKESHMAPPVKYPQIRFFSQSGKFQPLPQLPDGRRVTNAPDYPRQHEAAYFVASFYRHMNLAVPPTLLTQEVEALDEPRCKEIDTQVQALMTAHRLRPFVKEEARPEPARTEPARQEPHAQKVRK